MSMISEQVKQIRDVADSYREMKCDICTQKVLYEAADTIEALSAKVREQNLPAHGEWITDGHTNGINGTLWAACSICGSPGDLWDKYCRVCGAKMDGGK